MGYPHYKIDQKANNGVGNENRSRAGLGERLAGSNEQPSADSTANGNHGDLPGLEASVQAVAELDIQTVGAIAVGGSVLVLVVVALDVLLLVVGSPAAAVMAVCERVFSHCKVWKLDGGLDDSLRSGCAGFYLVGVATIFVAPSLRE